MTTNRNAAEDPLIEEVRSRRTALLASVGNDLHALMRAVQVLEAQHADLMVDRRKRRATSPASAESERGKHATG